ncbi:MAG: hypothetical protein LBG48_04905 [Rickettsiales bacterium]|jgi:hypothetical protein|nr:hypothetical protein [Rickettsiales bacterium]
MEDVNVVFDKDLDIFIKNESWGQLNVYCKNLKESSNSERLRLFKKSLERRVDRRFLGRNAYFIIDNVELLKNLIYLEEDTDKINEYKLLLERNITNLINYKTSEPDMEFSVIKAISNLSTSGILSDNISLELVRRNEQKIANFIANHSFLLENFTPGKALSNITLNNIKDEKFLLEKKYNISRNERSFEDGSVKLLQKFGENKNKDYERYLEVRRRLKKTKSIFSTLRNSDIMSRATEITQDIVTLFFMARGNTIARSLIQRITGVQLTPEVKQSNGIGRKIISCIKHAVFFLHRKAHGMARENLRKTLESESYHKERRENIKNGVKDPLKNRFFNFINRCSMFFNAVIKRPENYRQTVKLSNSVKSRLDGHFKENNIATILQNGSDINMSINAKLNFIRDNISKNKYLNFVYEKDIKNMEQKIETLQKQMANIHRSMYEVLPITKKRKNTLLAVQHNKEYQEIEEKLRQIENDSVEFAQSHFFLSKFWKEKSDVAALFIDEYKFKNSGELFKNERYCDIFVKKINFFSSSYKEMSFDEDFGNFNGYIQEEIRKDLQMLSNYFKNKKDTVNIKNLVKIRDNLQIPSEETPFSAFLVQKKEEIETLIENNDDISIKKSSRFYSFLENHYNTLNKELPERQSYALTKFVRKNFMIGYNINREFEEMLKLSLAGNPEAVAEKVMFLYSGYDKISETKEFNERIRNEFEKDINFLIEYAKNGKNAKLISDIHGIFSTDLLKNNFLNEILISKKPYIEKAIESNRSYEIKLISNYYSFIKKYTENNGEAELILISEVGRKENLNTLVKKIKFLYLNYNKMSQDPNFHLFADRIKQDFAESFQQLNNYIKETYLLHPENVSDDLDEAAHQIYSIFALKRDKNDLNGILISEKEKLDRGFLESGLEDVCIQPISSIFCKAITENTPKADVINLIQEACKNLKTKKCRLELLEEQTLILKDVQKMVYHKIVNREEASNILEKNGVNFEIDNLQTEYSEHLTMEKNVRKQLNNTIKKLCSFSEKMTKTGENNEPKGIARFFRNLASSLHLISCDKKKIFDTAIKNISFSLQHLFGRDCEICEESLEEETKQISLELKRIDEIMEKYNMPRSDFFQEIVFNINSFYKKLSEREEFLKQNKEKTTSFREFFEDKIKKNTKRYNIDENAQKRQEFLRERVMDTQEREEEKPQQTPHITQPIHVQDNSIDRTPNY